MGRSQTIIAKHSSRSPTHAHSHPRPQCGRCRERLPPRAQLHTGTELSASQARSSVEPSGRPTVRAPARLRPWAVAHGARCSAKLSKHPFPNSCPLSPTPTVWEWPRAVATAQPHIGTATARYTIGSKAAAGKEPKGDHRSGGSPPQRAHRGWPRVRQGSGGGWQQRDERAGQLQAAAQALCEAAR